MGEINITGTADILKYLTPSSKLNDADLAALRYLVLKYPYSQPLQFAYLSALKQHDKSEYDATLPKVALHAPNRALLYKFIQQPEHFIDLALELPHEEPPTPTLTEESILADEKATIVIPPASEESIPEKMPEEGLEEITPQEELLAASVVAVDGKPEVETIIPEAEIPTLIAQEEEIFEEETMQEHSGEETIEPVVASSEEKEAEQELAAEEVSSLAEPEVNLEDAARIAAKDFFTFDQSRLDPLRGAPVEVEEKDITEHEDKDKAEVTKFHDDTMPYTFLWWLHKTRKEYAAKFQPFVNNQPSSPTKQPVKELNHQIIENIFHIQPELNTFEAAALAESIEAELKRKEDSIIKKFIQEEPQIKPPQANKLDNENKARKSSEDSLDLVSETLARIYTDQMLYHKAIEIYKKLSLKFPDKNHYFAGQITELEKKIN